MPAVLAKMKQEYFAFLSDHPFEYAKIVLLKAEHMWVSGWWDPYSYGSHEQYGSWLNVLLFAGPVLALGALGWWRERAGPNAMPGGSDGSDCDEGCRRAARSLHLLTALYLLLFTAPLTVEARYSLHGFVPCALWLPAGVALLWTLAGRVLAAWKRAGAPQP